MAAVTPEKGTIEYSDDVLRAFGSPTLCRTPTVKRGLLASGAARIKTPSKSRTTTPSKLREMGSFESSNELSCRISTSNLSAGRPSIVSLPGGLNTSSTTNSYVIGGNWMLDGFIMSKPLGKGKFGNVYHAKQKGSNVPVALKVLFKAQMQNEMAQTMLKREVEIQYRLRHENILKLYGYFQDHKNVYLILEFAEGGEYTKFLTQFGNTMSEAICLHHMHQIVSGLAHMHARHVIHRDIKPENILIDKDGRLKIADLGSAVHMPPATPPSSSATPAKRYTMCGTPEYLAPEMIRCVGHDLSVDIWALGVLMYEIMFKRTPFTDNAIAAGDTQHHKKRKLDSLDEDTSNNNNSNNNLPDDADDGENRARKTMYTRILSFVDGHLSFEFSLSWLMRQQQHHQASTLADDSLAGVSSFQPPSVSASYRQHILRLLRSDAHARPSAAETLSALQDTADAL